MCQPLTGLGLHRPSVVGRIREVYESGCRVMGCPGPALGFLSICVRELEGWEVSAPLCMSCTQAGRAEVSRLWGAGPKELRVTAELWGQLAYLRHGQGCRVSCLCLSWPGTPVQASFPCSAQDFQTPPREQAAARRCRGVCPLSLPSAFTLTMIPDATCCVSSRWDLLSCSRTPTRHGAWQHQRAVGTRGIQRVLVHPARVEALTYLRDICQADLVPRL